MYMAWVRSVRCRELALAALAQLADMERNRIIERTAAGRERARDEGKHLGRDLPVSAGSALWRLQA